MFLHKWVFDLGTGKCVFDQPLSTVYCDFPMVSPRVTGRKMRYLYATRMGVCGKAASGARGVMKVDLETGVETTHFFSDLGGSQVVNESTTQRPSPDDAGIGGECFFVPRHGQGASSAEDDGFLVTYTYHKHSQASCFYVIDASTMAPAPLAIVRLPQRVPFGFHSLWIDSEKLM